MYAHTFNVGVMMGTWLHHDVPMLLLGNPCVHVTLVVRVTLVEVTTPAFHSYHVNLQHHTVTSVDSYSIQRNYDTAAALSLQRYSCK
jgi:lipopolysaccharide export system protein LptC